MFLKESKPDAACQAAIDFFVAHASQRWATLDSRLSRAQLALALHRLGDTRSAKLITRSLRERATVDPDRGMSWPDEADAGRWWQAPIEAQVATIEAFLEIDHDGQAAEDCRVWLIAHKQTTDWGTTTATADAAHALLADGPGLLDRTEPLRVALDGVPRRPDSVEPGTGFHEVRLAGAEIRPAHGKITLGKTGPGIAWAGVHWQYAEDLAKVAARDTPALRIEKTLHVRRNGPRGQVLEPVAGPLRRGEELVSRLTIRNDRPLDFVHLEDQRGSGTEPVNALSRYRWQDGIGFFETARDTASHFFIDALPAGVHVLESSVRVQHAGIYQAGVAEIRCMYAPAFAAHSASVGVMAE